MNPAESAPLAPPEIRHLAPFGFTFERNTNTPHFSETPYDIYLNGKFCQTANRNVVSLYGLTPDTDYQVRLLSQDDVSSPEEFPVRTAVATFVINVRDYGAIGDGTTCDTMAIAAAIYAAPEGSTIFFPAGTYRVQHLFLRSNLDYYLADGCTLKQDTTRTALAILPGYQRDYHHENAVINASWEGNPLSCYASLVYGKGVQNISFYGNGTIDGSGAESGFWENHEVKQVAYRPRNLFLQDCSDVLVAGIRSQNSASWNIHPFYSDRLTFLDLTLKSPADSPNTDGLNPESCSDVSIIGCQFYVGDDCIAIKSGKIFMAKEHYKPTQNLVVRNCLMEKGHGGVVVGSEISCGLSGLLVEQCYFRDTDRGLRIKTRRGRGATSVVEGITFRRNHLVGVIHCFVINMFYRCCDPDGESDAVQNKGLMPKNDGTPSIRGILLEQLSCEEIKGSGIFLYGLPESPITGVTVRESRFTYASERSDEEPAMMCGFDPIDQLGIFMENADNIEIHDNIFVGQYRNKINGRWEESV